MVGVRAWKPLEGQASDRIYDALRPEFKKLIEESSWAKYKSIDMKVGICIKGLEMFQDSLSRLVALDSRGGHFKQTDIYDAVERRAMDEEHMELFVPMLSQMDIEDFGDGITFVAY